MLLWSCSESYKFVIEGSIPSDGTKMFKVITELLIFSLFLSVLI